MPRISSSTHHPFIIFTPFSYCCRLQISNPLDVIKTRLQTQGEIGGKLGVAQTVRLVYSEGGFGAFFRGLGARMLYHAPAAAFQMVTYEAVKVRCCGLWWCWMLRKTVVLREVHFNASVTPSFSRLPSPLHYGAVFLLLWTSKRGKHSKCRSAPRKSMRRQLLGAKLFAASK